MALSGIAAQHDDDGDSKCGNSGSSLVHSMFNVFFRLHQRACFNRWKVWRDRVDV